jgi:hypothetical protein
MVSDNLSQDVEPCDYLVEQKESCCLPVVIHIFGHRDDVMTVS